MPAAGFQQLIDLCNRRRKRQPFRLCPSGFLHPFGFSERKVSCISLPRRYPSAAPLNFVPSPLHFPPGPPGPKPPSISLSSSFPLLYVRRNNGFVFYLCHSAGQKSYVKPVVPATTKFPNTYCKIRRWAWRRITIPTSLIFVTFVSSWLFRILPLAIRLKSRSHEP